MAHQENVWGTKQDTSIAAVVAKLGKHGGIMVAMAVAKGPDARPIRTRDGWTIEVADMVYLTYDGLEYAPLPLTDFVHAGDDVPWITDITDAVHADTSAEDSLGAEFDAVFDEITEVTGVYDINKARAARLDRCAECARTIGPRETIVLTGANSVCCKDCDRGITAQRALREPA